MGQYNSPWANALDEAEDELLRLASYVAASNKNQALTKRTTLRAGVTNAINAANNDSSLVPGVMPMIQDYVAKTGDSPWADTQYQAFGAIQKRYQKTARAYAGVDAIKSSLNALDPINTSGSGTGSGIDKIMGDLPKRIQSLDDTHQYAASNRISGELKGLEREARFYENAVKQNDWTANEILDDGTITPGVNQPGMQIDPSNPNSGLLEQLKFYISNKDAAGARTAIAKDKLKKTKIAHLGQWDDGTQKMATMISRDHAYKRDPNDNMRYIMDNGSPVLKDGVIHNDMRYPNKFLKLHDRLPAQEVGEIVDREYSTTEQMIINNSGATVKVAGPNKHMVTDAAGNEIKQNDVAKILNFDKDTKLANKETKELKLLDAKTEKERLVSFDNTMNQKYEDLHTVFESGPMKANKTPGGKWATGTNDTIKDMYNESKVLYKIMKDKSWHGNDKHKSVKKIAGIQQNIETYIQEIFEAHDESSWYQDDYDINSVLVDTYNNKQGGLSGAKAVLASKKFADAAGHDDPTEAAKKLANLFDFYGAKITNPGDSEKSLAQAQAIVRMYRIWKELELERMRRQKRAIDLGGGGSLP